MNSQSPRSPRFGVFANGYEVGGLAARLIGIPFPSSSLFREENLNGIHWLTCLSSKHPERRYSTDPWKIAKLDFVTLESPESADAVTKALILDLARRIQSRLHTGQGVIVHCDLGISRTGAVLGTVLALEGFSPQRVASGIADVIELQQPGWAGPRFPDELEQVIRECV